MHISKEELHSSNEELHISKDSESRLIPKDKENKGAKNSEVNEVVKGEFEKLRPAKCNEVVFMQLESLLESEMLRLILIIVVFLLVLKRIALKISFCHNYTRIN